MRRKSLVETWPELSAEKEGDGESRESHDQYEEQETEICESDDEDTVVFETEIDQEDNIQDQNSLDIPPPKKSKLEVANEFVTMTKSAQKQNIDQVLPDPRSIRRAHT